MQTTTTIIRRYSERNAKLIEARRLDGAACYDQNFDGDREAAEKWVRSWYGKAGRVDRTADSTCFRYVGFWIAVIER